MSTLATRPRRPRARSSSGGDSLALGDQRIVIRGVGRQVYDCLSEAIGEGQHVRLLYDGKDLELMTTGNIHERYKDWFGAIVRAVTMGLDLDYVACGETTWKSVLRGLEADLSYYFDAEKIRVAQAAFARMSMAPADYPWPDLAVEIDMSPPQVDRPAIYQELRVFEVWRLIRGQKLIIEQLQADGSYAPVEESRFLRIRGEEVIRWLNGAATEREATWNRRLNQWAMELGRRARPGPQRAGAALPKRKGQGIGKSAPKRKPKPKRL
jgi:Uma2 family endonuclease